MGVGYNFRYSSSFSNVINLFKDKTASEHSINGTSKWNDGVKLIEVSAAGKL